MQLFFQTKGAFKPKAFLPAFQVNLADENHIPVGRLFSKSAGIITHQVKACFRDANMGSWIAVASR